VNVYICPETVSENYFNLPDIDIHSQLYVKKIIQPAGSFLFLFITSGAQAEYVQLVAFLDIAVFADKLVLNFFEVRAVNLHELAAFRADKMVVVFVAVLMLETLRAVTEIDLPANSRFAHQFDRSCYRRIAYTGVFFPYQIMQLLCGKVLFRGQEHVQHLFPLGGLPQFFCSNKLPE